MTNLSQTLDPNPHALESGDETFVTRTKQRGISEREFSRWVCKNWHSFVARVEAGLGGDPGNADLLLLTDMGLTPVELKTGRVHGGKLISDDVRPAQVQWHSRLSVSGGISLLLVHTSDGLFAVDATYLNQWEEGFHIGTEEADDAYPIDPNNFSESIEAFVMNVLCG